MVGARWVWVCLIVGTQVGRLVVVGMPLLRFRFGSHGPRACRSFFVSNSSSQIKGYFLKAKNDEKSRHKPIFD